MYAREDADKTFGGAVWAAFVNALPMPLAATTHTADLILTIILIAGFFFFTFLGAFLRFMHPLGLGLLGGYISSNCEWLYIQRYTGATGGTSLMMRVVIFKKDLLIPIYPVNFVLLGVGAIVGVALIVRKRRVMVVRSTYTRMRTRVVPLTNVQILATSLISTFLLGLGVDLILNIKAPPQQGMSRGLRLLMDRNGAHLAVRGCVTLSDSILNSQQDIVGTQYEPALKTQVILGASLGLV